MAAFFKPCSNTTHCNAHGLEQLVGLTVIITVVIIVMNYMSDTYMKAVNNYISPEALATYSAMNKHYKNTYMCLDIYLVKLMMKMNEKMVSFLMNLMLDLNRQNYILLIMMISLLEPWSNHYALNNVPRSGQLLGLTVTNILWSS